MASDDEPCLLCAPELADREFDRVRLWEGELWRLSAVLLGDRVAHLHVNLVPHLAGDVLRGGPGLLSPDAVDVGPQAHAATADAVRELLCGFSAAASS